MKHQQLNIFKKIFLLIIFIAMLFYIIIRFAPIINPIISSPETFRNMLISYGNISIPVFIAFQIMQVVIAVIPGEIVQIAAGYVYGTLAGSLYSTIGILLGTMLAFTISRGLGYPILCFFISREKLSRFDFLINSPRAELLIFLLFLIPGIPKDLLSYFTGLTPIRPLRLFLISTVARFPGILVSAYIGANIHSQNYPLAIILSIIAVILLLLGLHYRDRILTHLNSRFHHL